MLGKCFASGFVPRGAADNNARTAVFNELGRRSERPETDGQCLLNGVCTTYL